jgi:hypothetical protein
MSVRWVTSSLLSKIAKWGRTEGKTMHGNKKVIEQLNAALASELTAIVQYMVQSETCQN